MVAEACGHALNVKSELVGEGVGGRHAPDVTTDVASNEAATKGEAEKILGVRKPISEGEPLHSCLFCGQVRNPVPKRDMRVLGRISSVAWVNDVGVVGVGFLNDCRCDLRVLGG